MRSDTPHPVNGATVHLSLSALRIPGPPRVSVHTLDLPYGGLPYGQAPSGAWSGASPTTSAKRFNRRRPLTRSA